MKAGEKLHKMAEDMTDFNVDMATKTAEFNLKGAKKGFEKAEKAHKKAFDKIFEVFDDDEDENTEDSADTKDSKESDDAKKSEDVKEEIADVPVGVDVGGSFALEIDEDGEYVTLNGVLFSAEEQ